MRVYESTPVMPLLGGGDNRLFVKRDDLLPFSLGGNKVRIAEAFLSDMKEKGKNALIMYGNSRSNLCRVLASACRADGVPCLMVCSGDPDHTSLKTGNSRIVSLFEVEVISCAKNAIAPAVDEAFARLESRGYDPYYIYGNRLGEGNEGTAARAYAASYREILEDERKLGLHFDYIFHASGTGATQSGLMAGHLLAADEKKIVGISVSRDRERGTGIIREGIRAYFRDCGLALPEGFEKEIELCDSYLAGGYGKYDGEILEVIREQFRVNSLPLDPTYTGKAFFGMTKYLRRMGVKGKNVLFLHTGGLPLFFDALPDLADGKEK
ncbi:MAG: pyridoxal-phosphate dependent enzyme [Lachnospiraceae bacterium]|nr:pyridoxal-phosphate dependent enzyme [Lachnospiraceae bacterium]